MTAGCVADTCVVCTCTPSYLGCRRAADLPHPCPLVDCVTPNCCRAEADCASESSCAHPGTTWGCGACQIDPGDCTSDTACLPGSICEPIVCSCLGAKHCVPGCLDDSACTNEEVCNPSSGRCGPRACSATNPCPHSFSCASGQCARKSCVKDTDCTAAGDSFCIENSCYPSLGECRGPVPEAGN